MKLSRMTAEEYVLECSRESANLAKDINSKKEELAGLQLQYDLLLGKRDELSKPLIAKEDEINVKSKLLDLRQKNIEANEIKIDDKLAQISKTQKELEDLKQGLVQRARLYEEKDFYRQQEVDKKLANTETLKNEYLALHDKVKEQIKETSDENLIILELKDKIQEEYNLAIENNNKSRQLQETLKSKIAELDNETIKTINIREDYKRLKAELDFYSKTLDEKDKDLQIKERTQEENSIYQQSLQIRLNELIEQYQCKEKLRKEGMIK